MAHDAESAAEPVYAFENAPLFVPRATCESQARAQERREYARWRGDARNDDAIVTLSARWTGTRGTCLCTFYRDVRGGVDDDGKPWIVYDGNDAASCGSCDPDDANKEAQDDMRDVAELLWDAAASWGTPRHMEVQCGVHTPMPAFEEQWEHLLSCEALEAVIPEDTTARPKPGASDEEDVYAPWKSDLVLMPHSPPALHDDVDNAVRTVLSELRMVSAYVRKVHELHPSAPVALWSGF
uniref:Uncharacterized protein n=1 Tax=viral metagenome TaxID=1070528 RepID=A0A6C0AT36_9ZZZZ